VACSVNQLEDFVPTSTAIKDYLLGRQFEQRLVYRYKRFEILAEGGLRTAVAELLRSRLRQMAGTAKGYRVTCETRLLGENVVVPDILIYRNGNPRIWIELKDTASFTRKLAEADWKKLQAHCPKYKTVKAGYFIYVARRASQEFPIKRTRATLRFWAIPIVLENCMGSYFQEWNEKYKTLAHHRLA
jgi:hypothetical protein